MLWASTAGEVASAVSGTTPNSEIWKALSRDLSILRMLLVMRVVDLTPTDVSDWAYDRISTSLHHRHTEQIACTDTNSGTSPGEPGYICAFYQRNGNKAQTLSDTNFFLGEIMDHGCKVCGSVPTKGGNNVDDGELTVNFIANAHIRCDRSPGIYNGGDGASGWLWYPGWVDHSAAQAPAGSSP